MAGRNQSNVSTVDVEATLKRIADRTMTGRRLRRVKVANRRHNQNLNPDSGCLNHDSSFITVTNSFIQSLRHGQSQSAYIQAELGTCSNYIKTKILIDTGMPFNAGRYMEQFVKVVVPKGSQGANQNSMAMAGIGGYNNGGTMWKSSGNHGTSNSTSNSSSWNTSSSKKPPSFKIDASGSSAAIDITSPDKTKLELRKSFDSFMST